MGKFYGKVGYSKMVESPPDSGIWVEEIIERRYFGDTVRFESKWQPSGNVNDNLIISQQVKILADAYAYENFSRIKYVEVMGALWKVTNAIPERPRITLTLGGVYNGQTTRVSSET